MTARAGSFVPAKSTVRIVVAGYMVGASVWLCYELLWLSEPAEKTPCGLIGLLAQIMAIYNLGSLNIDHIYRLAHLPEAGETLSANHYAKILGGKGANQSVALARASAQVRHIGAIGQADAGHLKMMQDSGVDIRYIRTLDEPSGHAIIFVDEGSGENQIVLSQGANGTLVWRDIEAVLQDSRPSDWALAQNETNLVGEFLRAAKERGLSICYSAAPFVAEQTAKLLAIVDLLVLNEVEVTALCAHSGKAPAQLELPHLIITKGENGAEYYGIEGQFELPAVPTKAVDTTGAGDTFLGYLLAGLSRQEEIREAMQIAIRAAAIQVGRPGAMPAIPYRDEI